MPGHKGSCQCGKVTYEVEADPIMVYACHCSKCQPQSGSAFGMAVVFNAQAVELKGLEPAHFVRPGHGDRKFRCYFCPECGTRIYHQWFTADGDFPFLSIKPGTLDETSWIKPGCHVWAENKQPWVVFGDDEIVFQQQPDIDQMPKFKQN